jgi:hypothetical protein
MFFLTAKWKAILLMCFIVSPRKFLSMSK